MVIEILNLRLKYITPNYDTNIQKRYYIDFVSKMNNGIEIVYKNSENKNKIYKMKKATQF